MTPDKPFSQDLLEWASSKKPKTIAGLAEVFEEKSFAVLFVVLMALPATPLPTGGLTHAFEVIVVLLALELVVGRRSIWLPDKWRHKQLGPNITKKGIPYLAKKIAWAEKFSRPRWAGVTRSRLSLPVIGLLVIMFTLMAFFAPPFSGLDTLPSLGVVILSLGLIFEDTLFMIAGALVGSIGIALVIGLGASLYKVIF